MSGGWRGTSLRKVLGNSLCSGLCVVGYSAARNSYEILLALPKSNHVKARLCAQVIPENTNYRPHGFHKKKETVS